MAAQLGLCPEKFAGTDYKFFCKEAETSLLPQGFLQW